MFKLIQILKNYYEKILIIFSIILLFLVIWFKGIHINYINNNHQEQYQYQGQLSINLFVSNGLVEWKAKLIKDTIEDYCIEKSKLSPEQSYFSYREIEYHFWGNKYYLIYPEFKNR